MTGPETVYSHRYTPGSYWINPPQPRSVDGRHTDPYTGAIVEFDMSGHVIEVEEDGRKTRRGNVVEVSEDGAESDELSAAERAILEGLSMD